MKNTVTLVGFVGNTPEVRTLHAGQTVTSVSLATSRSWKDGEGKRQSEPNGTASAVSTGSARRLPVMSPRAR